MRKATWKFLVICSILGVLINSVSYAASVDEIRNSIQARMQMLNEPPPPNLVLEPATGIREKGAKALALWLMGEKGVERYNQHYSTAFDYNMRAKESLVYATNFLNQGDIQTAEKYLKMSNDITQIMNEERTAAFETWQRDLERVNEIEHRIAKAGVATAKITFSAAAIVAEQPGLLKDINNAGLVANYFVDTTFAGMEVGVKNALIGVLVSGLVDIGNVDLRNLSNDMIAQLTVYLAKELQKLGLNESGVVEAFLNVLGKKVVMFPAGKPTPPQQKVNVSNISVQNGLQEFKKLAKPFQPITAPFKQSLDKDKLRGGDPQQNVTPVKVEFTQTFDGLFTQSAAGIHSGTLTNGTRVNVTGDSRPGNFTGSFSGDTVAVPGYTPATHNNSAFSGSSVGTVSAKGFKEGQLEGDMTVTIPAGTQTTTVSGDITIETNGSLSMPSCSGPVTDNATSAEVGTMSGKWDQSKTTP